MINGFHGLRGRLARERNWELDISVDGSFSADSGDNKARKGMPDLDWLGELGSRLQVTLARAARDAKINFELPVRAVISTDLAEFDFRGFIAAPQLTYQHENFYFRDLELKLGVGSNFVTTKTADYATDQIFYAWGDQFPSPWCEREQPAVPG